MIELEVEEGPFVGDTTGEEISGRYPRVHGEARSCAHGGKDLNSPNPVRTGVRDPVPTEAQRHQDEMNYNPCAQGSETPCHGGLQPGSVLPCAYEGQRPRAHGVSRTQ